MSITYYGGRILMKADEYISFDEDVYGASEYPFEEPTVFLNGYGEDWFPLDGLSWSDDSVILARKERVLVYTESHSTEVLTKNETGDVVWVNGRKELSRCANAHPSEMRPVTTYSVVEYDLNTLTKKKYNLLLEEERSFGYLDFCNLEEFIGEERVEELKAKQAEEQPMMNLTLEDWLAQNDDKASSDTPIPWCAGVDEIPF